jgi:hypothetical protein
LKKRTKKLLFLELPRVSSSTDRRQRRKTKSFLLLFFKKEVLAFARPAFPIGLKAPREYFPSLTLLDGLA